MSYSPYEAYRPGFDEVQEQIARDAANRLYTLVTSSDANPESGDLVEESIADISPEGRIVSSFTAASRLFELIHPDMIRGNELPDYLLDILKHTVTSIDGEYKIGEPLANNTREELSRIWRERESDRLNEADFDLVTINTDSLSDVVIRFMHDKDSKTWSLNYVFTEQREYLLIGQYIHRNTPTQLFGDPIGSEGDELNVRDGIYLPSRLDPILFKLPKTA